MVIKKALLLLAALLLIVVGSPHLVLAQSRLVEARVTVVLEEKISEDQLYQRLELITSRGEKIILTTRALPLVSGQKYQVGDKLLLEKVEDESGQTNWQIFDYHRKPFLAFLFLVFIILALTTARQKGLTSLLGMGLSFLFIFHLFLPELMAGRNPVLVSVFIALALIPITFFLSHGLNLKTVVAIVATLLSLGLTIALASWSINQAHLSGFVSEEVGFLQDLTNGRFNLQGLLLAGIILSLVGILDDITISQAAITFELERANPSLSRAQLYWRAMRVGRDHIASMVNTLILVYAGAALPLFLLFYDSQRSLGEIINSEIVAEEIVRSLVASIGLILAVPITTLLAVWLAKTKS